MHLISRQTCRACGSKALKPAIDLGMQYLQGSFVKPGKEIPPQRQIPTTLLRCDPASDENACGLLQMQHSVPPKILYAAYWYRSGTNQTMRNHLGRIANAVVDKIGSGDATVLDIGCNDGTLLQSYPSTFTKWGVDPSDVAQEIKRPVHVIQDTFPSAALSQAIGESKFDAITSIAMFYDLEDPVGFVRQIASLLAPGGVWVFEMSYLPEMLRKNSYDTICHEHLEYYSLAVLESIVRRGGMKIFDASLNEINGGSIRCFATHANNSKCRDSETLEQLRMQEFDLELDTDRPYVEFQKRIERHRSDLSALLRRFKSEGKSIHVYGASTKGNTLLQWCGIDSSIVECAAERNPDKFGARTLGTNIPIVSESESRAMKPDYYLVLPWHFKAEFLERERETLEAGVGMIFPLPEIEVVTGRQKIADGIMHLTKGSSGR